jgi:hypothetical protein
VLERAFVINFGSYRQLEGEAWKNLCAIEALQDQILLPVASKAFQWLLEFLSGFWSL